MIKRIWNKSVTIIGNLTIITILLSSLLLLIIKCIDLINSKNNDVLDISEDDINFFTDD